MNALGLSLSPTGQQTLRCAYYLRVSDDDGSKEENSIDTQRSCCEAWLKLQRANKKPVEYVDEFVDLGRSATDLDRPSLKRLLDLVEARVVNTIVCSRLDRLTRSLLDFCRLAEAFDGQGVKLVTTNQDIDTSTPQGRLLIQITAMFAEYERAVNRENTIATMRKRLREGKWNGGVIPYGYRCEAKRLLPDPKEAKIYRRIFDAALRGSLPEQIAHEEREIGTLRRGGKRPFDTADIRRILLSPIPAGRLNDAGELRHGIHEALVDVEEWLKVRKFIESSKPLRAGVAPSKHSFLLNGLLWCGCCDRPITGYVTRGIKYYACQNHRRGDAQLKCTIGNLRTDQVEQVVRGLVGDICRLPEIVDQFTLLAQESTAQNVETKERLESLGRARKAKLEQIEAVKHEIRNSRGVVKEEWRNDLNRLLEERDALSFEIDSLTGEREASLKSSELSAKIYSAAQRAGDEFKALDAESQSKLIRALIPRIVVNRPGGKTSEERLNIPIRNARNSYLLNPEFFVKSLSQMLSKHFADNSTKIGSWLPG